MLLSNPLIIIRYEVVKSSSFSHLSYSFSPIFVTIGGFVGRCRQRRVGTWKGLGKMKNCVTLERNTAASHRGHRGNE